MDQIRALLDRMPHIPGGWWWLVSVLPGGVILYLLLGMAFISVVDTSPGLDVGVLSPQQSRAIAVAGRLVKREIEDHPWTANDPFFQPGWWLDDMPNFQQGVVGSAARYAAALAQISDQGQGGDAELMRAAGLLKYPGTIWKFDPRASWAPTASTEKQYRNAARNLDSFNQRLAVGEASLPATADALAFLVARLGEDLAASSSDIDAHLAQGGWLPVDLKSDDVFFAAKGRVYGAWMILAALGQDYRQIVADRGLGPAWERMLDSLKTAALLAPLVVLNGAPDGLVFPSHLTAQGFHLLRARVQMDEIARSLAKPPRP